MARAAETWGSRTTTTKNAQMQHQDPLKLGKCGYSLPKSEGHFVVDVLLDSFYCFYLKNLL